MIYPVYNIFYSFLSAIALFFASRRVQLYYKKTLSPLAKYFRDMSLSAGIVLLIHAFSFVLFANKPLFLGIGIIIGGTFALIAHVFGVAIFFYLVFPSFSSKKIISAGVALAILINLITICHIEFLPRPEINANGIVEFNFSSFSKIVLSLFSTAGLLPLSIAFIREAVISRRLRIRSGFAAFALLFIAIANSFYGVQHDALAFLILPAIAYVMLIIAVILRVEATSV